MSEDFMPTFRQKIKLNNEELMFFHQDVNSWREVLKDVEKEELYTLEDLCYALSSDEESGNDPAEAVANEGNKCLQKGEWSKAISFYTSAISRKNTVARYYTNRALGYLKRNSPAEAEKDCSQAISLNPHCKKAYLRRACARKQLGKCKESCDDLEEVLKMEPENNVALAEYEAMFEYIQKDLLKNETEDDARRLEKIENAVKMKELGNKLIKTGDYVKAMEKFTTAIMLNPKEPTYYANRAICHMKSMNFRAAENDCNEALQLDLEYVKVYIRRGRVRRKLGKMYDARQDFYNAYELDSKDSSILDELEEVDNLIRKSEETRKKKGMEVEEVGIISLLESRNGGGDGRKVITLDWNELRPRKGRSRKQEAESTEGNEPKSERPPNNNNGPTSRSVHTNENRGEHNPTQESPKAVEDNSAFLKTSPSLRTNCSDVHNMREVFPLQRNDPAAKFSGPFLKVRVGDAKFAVPEKLLEIPDELKIIPHENGRI